MTRINTNVPALTAIHQLTANNKSLTTSLERLSSGLRINRGADDPAGLIASESLRSEIRGISTAISNSERAINVISTADAALGEVSKLLLELKGLTVQTANDGGLSDDEIEANQQQVDSLLVAIDRIANSTQFNGKKLLNGQLRYTINGQDTANLPRLQVFGARVPDNGTLNVDVAVTQSAQTAQLNINFGGSTGFQAGGTLSAGNGITLEIRGSLGTTLLSFASGTAASDIAQAVQNTAQLTGVSATASATGLAFNSTRFGSSEFVSVRAINGTFAVNAGDQGDNEDRGRDAQVFVNGQAASVKGLTASIRTAGLDLVTELSQTFGTTAGSTDTFSITGGGANFQIGPNVNADGRVSIGIESITTANLGTVQDGFLSSLGTGGSAELVSPENLPAAERIVSAAISQISTLSGRLGGFQANQVETNLNSLRVALENVTASESAIRDTDYSAEVANLTRAQILLQSTTQTLGIANQIPQSVLSLLG
ncbi:MAG: flagellin [Phycisphaerales bacterium]|nr:flagellin [Phycisphaerales bacterium]MCB9858054.1 flagellin [Phycisphaerales bacterium]MCB9864151.1 flagellin [Phycisphaerales bacterium]